MIYRTEAEDRAYQDGYRAACRNVPVVTASDARREIIEHLKVLARSRPERTITLADLEDFFK